MRVHNTNEHNTFFSPVLPLPVSPQDFSKLSGIRDPNFGNLSNPKDAELKRNVFNMAFTLFLNVFILCIRKQ